MSKQQVQVQHEIINDSTNTKRYAPSQFYQQYQEQLKLNPVDRVQKIKLFTQFGIKFEPESPYQSFKFQIKEAILQYHILRIQVKIGQFQINLMVLNESIDNPLESQAIQAEGNYGKVYCIELMKEKIAIKSIKYEQSVQANFQYVFNLIVKEWAIFKICSVIGCAPKTERYFGFDIIVYNDAIQIAMENGNKQQKLSSANRSQFCQTMKCQLALMHSLGIVHCDIKPDNIIFSPLYNKFVFIDFGFSILPQQKQGYKTETYFKGSPEFCGPEMLNLLGSKNAEYVDFYYNDLCCLKATINDFQKKQPKLKQSINEYQDEPFWDVVIQTDSKNYETHFLLNAFKYEYLQTNIIRLNTILNFNDFSLAKTYFQQLLCFIKAVFHIVFHPNIFSQYFKHFQLKNEYLQIQHLQKRQRQFIFNAIFKQKYEQQTLIDVKQKRFSKIQLGNRNYDRFINYQLMLSCLENKKIYQKVNEQQIYGMLLECLRFDKKNLCLNQKLLLSAKFKNLKVSNSQKHQQSLQDIKFVFSFMSKYLIEGQLTEWKHQKGFEVFYQSIMLGMQCSDLILEYLDLLKKTVKTMVDKFILLYDIAKIDKLHDLKDSKYKPQILPCIDILQKQFLQLKCQILGMSAKSTEEQIIILLMKQYTNMSRLTNNEIQLISETNNQINNIKLKKYFTLAIFDDKFKRYFQNIYAKNAIQSLRDLYKQYEQHLFISQIFGFRFLWYQLFKPQQFSDLTNELQSLIGCPQIYHSLVFEKYCFIFDQNNQNQQLTLKYLKQICINDSEPLNTSLDVHIVLLFFKIVDNRSFLESNIELITQVYRIYTQNNSLMKKINPKFDQRFQTNIILKMKLASIIPEIQIQLQELPIEIEQKYIECQRKIANSLSQQQMQLELKLKQKYLCLLTVLYEYSGKVEEYINSLFQKVYLYEKLQDNAEYINSYIKIILALFTYDKLHWKGVPTVNYTNQLILLLIQRDSVMLLLNKKTKKLLKIIFECYKNAKMLSQIYRLLNQLSKYIFINPLDVYLQTFIQIIFLLYKKCSSIFQYRQFKRNFEKVVLANPYFALNFIYCVQEEREQIEKIKIMKCIALKLEFLTKFAQKFIFVKYFQFLLKLSAISLKQKSFLIMRYAKRIISRNTLMKWHKIYKHNIQNKATPINGRLLKQLKVKIANIFL